MNKETKEAITEAVTLTISLVYLVVFHNFQTVLEYWRAL